MQYLSNLDLNRNELQNAKIQNLAVAPLNPTAGLIYFNTAMNTFMGHNGLTWVDLGQVLTADSIASLINNSTVIINDANLSTNANNVFTKVNAITSTPANIDDAVNKKHAQNTDNTLTNSGSNAIITTGAGNIVDFKVGTTTKTSIDVNGNFTGNASTATKLITGRTISLTGDISGTSSAFDGSSDLSFTTTLKNVGTAGVQQPKVTTDAQGRVISSTALVATDIPTLTASKISDFATQVRTNRLDQMAAPTTAVSMNSQKITNLADPTGAQDAVTKAYADNLRAGLSLKDPVKVATTANITLSGLQTIDGISLVAGNRVLVKNQTDATQNGIYVVSATAWTRSTDADNSSAGEVTEGLTVWVDDGTVNASTRWVLTTNDVITLGTTPLTFTKDFQSTDITANGGLTKVGNTISLVTGVVTAGTYSKVTVDTTGRVVGGANVTATDIGLGNVTNESKTTMFTSPMFTGTPTAPTAAVSTNSTQIATTAYVKSQGYITKYSANVGDGISTSITVNHNLNSLDVMVQLREALTSPYNVVMADIQIIDANNVKLLFAVAPTSGQYRVTVIG